MRLLLDTHVVLWQFAGTQRLGPQAEHALAAASELRMSVVSFAEIGIKASIGKLAVPAGLHDHVTSTGLRVLGLSGEHGLRVANLPLHHRDPFDRLLIAQALEDDLVLMTADERVRAYDVPTIDALA